MTNPDFSLLLPQQWDYDILEDGRIIYFKQSKSEENTAPFQWIPPLDTWTQLNDQVLKEPSVISLPYGIEMAYDATGNSYYISHITLQTLRDLPESKVETRDRISKKLKEVNISRHPLVGYGFMLSSNPPLFVSHVVPGGPADGKLSQGDLLYCIHGHDVTIQVSTDDVLGAIETSLDPQVLQIAVVPKPKPRNKRPPPPPAQKAKVRFNTPLFEVMSEEDGSFIRIRAATGSEHVLKVNTSLTFGEIITALKGKLHLNCPVDTLGIVATRLSNRITLPPTLLVTDSVLRSSDGWNFHLRIRILPLNLDELLIRCPASLSYLYFQTCHDLFSGYYIADVSSLTQLLSIRIWFESVRSYPGKSRPRKPTYKSMRRLGGFEVFLPKIWIDRASLHSKKDLFKQIIYQISRSKYPSDELSIMLLFLKKCLQYISAFGGALFHAQVQFLDKVTRICVLPLKGVFEEKVLTDIRSAPTYSTLVNLCEIIEVHVTEFSRSDDLSKVRLSCINGKELIFIMRLYDGCELGEVLQSYYSQRIRPIVILKDSISNSISTFSSTKFLKLADVVPSSQVDHQCFSSINPIKTTFSLPSYQSTHLVVPQIWSYIFDSPTPPNTLHQFSPLNFPLKLSGRIRVSSSDSRSGSLITELMLDQSHQQLSGSPSETYFTDSFDEVTDSESEEYNLEVPNQFLKESLEKIHCIKSDAPHNDTNILCDEHKDSLNLVQSTNTPGITIDLISDYLGEAQNSRVVPNSPTGIPPPPTLKCAKISFERLSTLLQTPPSPTCSDNGTERFSTFSSSIIPRSTSDRSLKVRSDTILSTHCWHSKYEHLYPRRLTLDSPSFNDYSMKNMYITTHVDDQPTPLKFDETASLFEPFEKYSISFDVLKMNSAKSNDEERKDQISLKYLPLSPVLDSQIETFPSIHSSSDEYNSGPSEEDVIVLRPPPPVPTADKFNESEKTTDPITIRIQVSPISALSKPIPVYTRSVAAQQIYHEEIVAPVSEPIPYQPVAMKRNRLRELYDYSVPCNIPEPHPKAQVLSCSPNSPDIIRRPPSMFAEVDLSVQESEIGHLSHSPTQILPIVSFPRGSQERIPAHITSTNTNIFPSLPPKATPRHTRSSKELFVPNNQLPNPSHIYADVLSISKGFESTALDDQEIGKVGNESTKILEIESKDRFHFEGIESSILKYHTTDSFSCDEGLSQNFQTAAPYQYEPIDTISCVPVSDPIESQSYELMSNNHSGNVMKLLKPPLTTRTDFKPFVLSTAKVVKVEEPSISESDKKRTSLHPGINLDDIHLINNDDSDKNAIPLTYSLHGMLSSIDVEKGNMSLFDDTKSKSCNISSTSETHSPFENEQVPDDINPQFSLHEPILSQSKPVMILTDPDPTLNQSISELLMKQFNIPNPDNSNIIDISSCEDEILCHHIPPASIHHSNVLIGRPIPSNCRPKSQPYHSKAIDEHSKSYNTTPYDNCQVVSNEIEDTISEVDSTNDVLLHRDSGVATSIESTNFPQDFATPNTITQEEGDQMSKPTLYIRAGNTDIRSARSIELFDRYPHYEPPNRTFSPHFFLQTIPIISRCNYTVEKKDPSSSTESAPPPLPKSAPPELGDTDQIDN